MHKIKAKATTTAKAAEALRCPLVRVRHPYLHEWHQGLKTALALATQVQERQGRGRRHPWHPGGVDGQNNIAHPTAALGGNLRWGSQTALDPPYRLGQRR